MSRMRKVAWIILSAVCAHGTTFAQVGPVALTKEEIEKELKSARKIAGEITLNGKRLCSFDSDKTSSYPWRSLNSGEAQPDAWAVVTSTPQVVIKLSTGAPEGLTLTRLRGESNGKIIVLEKDSPAATYRLRFAQSPPLGKDAPGPGDYEFGTTKGTLAFFFRCGFTIE